MKPDLGANSLSVQLFDSPHEAPKYNKPEYLFAQVASACVVGRGTVSGNPTVDLIFEDERGQKYTAMLTGGIIENLAGAVRGMRERTR